MKKATLMLFAMALVMCAAVAQATFPADSPQCNPVLAGDDCQKDCGCHGQDHGICKEMCLDQDKCGKCCKKCNDDSQKGLVCTVIERCGQCEKTWACDGICDQCGKKCQVMEYCAVCNIKYTVEHADGRCDKCGRDCYCIEKCGNCGNVHNFNGYCDECASRCLFERCCHKMCDNQGQDCCNCQQHDQGCYKAPQECSTCMNKEKEAGGMNDMQAGSPMAAGMFPVMRGTEENMMPYNAAAALEA